MQFIQQWYSTVHHITVAVQYIAVQRSTLPYSTVQYTSTVSWYSTESHQSRTTVHVRHAGEDLKCGCCCYVAASRHTASKSRFGTLADKYWCTTAMTKNIVMRQLNARLYILKSVPCPTYKHITQRKELRMQQDE